MPWTTVAHFVKGSPDKQGFTSDPCDTTGANLLIFAGVNIDSFTVSDNKGNTWQLASENGSSYYKRTFIAKNPTVGTGHTFTMSGVDSSPAMAVMAVKDADLTAPLDQSNNNGGYSVSTSPGPVTPTEDGELIVTSTLCDGQEGVCSIDSGFTIVDQIPALFGAHWGIALATLSQSTAATVTPTWTVNPNNLVGSTIISLKSGTPVGPGPRDLVGNSGGKATTTGVLSGSSYDPHKNLTGAGVATAVANATISYAAPKFVAAGTLASTSSNGATFSPGLPSGWQAGDIHVLIAARKDTTTMTALSGWTQYASLSGNNSTIMRTEVWWRRAVAGDTAPTVTFGTSTILRWGQILGFRGCLSSADPLNVLSRRVNTSSATVSTTDITPTSAPSLGVFAFTYPSGPTSATQPTNWTTFVVGRTGSAGGAIGYSTRNFSGAAGAYGAPTTTASGQTNSVNDGLLLALVPNAVVSYKNLTGGSSGAASVSGTISKGATRPHDIVNRYTTTFPLTETPIAEGGAWAASGLGTGLDWSNVSTVPGKAYGTQTNASSTYADSIANLGSGYLNDQDMSATVFIDPAINAQFAEVELLFRFAITSHNAVGYEINWSCSNTGGGYCSIVRWPGPRGTTQDDFNIMTTTFPGVLHNGDVVRGTIVGNVITAYINGVQVAQATDTGTPIASGPFGIGFFAQNLGGGRTSADWGFTSFSGPAKAVLSSGGSSATGVLTKIVGGVKRDLTGNASGVAIASGAVSAKTGARLSAALASGSVSSSVVTVNTGVTFSTTVATATTQAQIAVVKTGSTFVGNLATASSQELVASILAGTTFSALLATASGQAAISLMRTSTGLMAQVMQATSSAYVLTYKGGALWLAQANSISGASQTSVIRTSNGILAGVASSTSAAFGASILSGVRFTANLFSANGQLQSLTVALSGLFLAQTLQMLADSKTANLQISNKLLAQISFVNAFVYAAGYKTEARWFAQTAIVNGQLRFATIGETFTTTSPGPDIVDSKHLVPSIVSAEVMIPYLYSGGSMVPSITEGTEV